MEEKVPVIPSLVEAGVFGDVKFVKLQSDDGTELGAQFASVISFVNMTVRSSNGEEIYPLVVKLAFDDPDMRDKRDCKTMFHNELVMYKEILPSLQVDVNSYPKLYYGLASEGAASYDDLIILENLTKRGFVLSKDKIFLDFDHISLAIKNIAKFHSMSYIMKQKDSDRFYELSKKLKEVVPFKSTQEESKAVGLVSLKRGIKPLLKNGVDNILLEKFIHYLQLSDEIRDLINRPEEPFAVICHGDYCNNNILYRYDSTGKPIECAIFDFQLSRFASPAIDLFFLLYMNTTAEVREKHWDDILKLYWDTLSSSVPEHITIPSFQEHLKHFACRAVYGYTICAWFLPILTAEDTISIEEYSEMSLEEKIKRFGNMGGEKCDILVSDIVWHLFNKGYIHAFVEFCEEKNVGC